MSRKRRKSTWEASGSGCFATCNWSGARPGSGVVRKQRAAEIKSADQQGRAIAQCARRRDTEAARARAEQIGSGARRQRPQIQLIDRAAIITDGRIDALLALEDHGEIGCHVVIHPHARRRADSIDEQQSMPMVAATEDHAQSAAIGSHATITRHRPRRSRHAPMHIEVRRSAQARADEGVISSMTGVIWDCRRQSCQRRGRGRTQSGGCRCAVRCIRAAAAEPCRESDKSEHSPEYVSHARQFTVIGTLRGCC